MFSRNVQPVSKFLFFVVGFAAPAAPPSAPFGRAQLICRHSLFTFPFSFQLESSKCGKSTAPGCKMRACALLVTCRSREPCTAIISCISYDNRRNQLGGVMCGAQDVEVEQLGIIESLKLSEVGESPSGRVYHIFVQVGVGVGIRNGIG